MLLVAGRPVSTELLEELKQMAGTCSRRQLAQQLCQRMDWRSPSGGLPLMIGRLALKELADQGHLPLPPARPSPQRVARAEVLAEGAPEQALECSLAELGELEVVLVGKGGSALSRQWNELMRQHYLVLHFVSSLTYFRRLEPSVGVADGAAGRVLLDPRG